MPKSLGICLGDAAGIGPEVTLKALAAKFQADDTRYLLIGDDEHVRNLNRRLSLGLPLEPVNNESGTRRIQFANPLSERLPSEPAAGSPAAARAAIDCLKDGAERALRGEID